jgi:hypothetical protein
MKFSDTMARYLHFADRVSVFLQKVEYDFKNAGVNIKAIKSSVSSTGGSQFINVFLINTDGVEPFKIKTHKFRIFRDGESIYIITPSENGASKSKYLSTLPAMDTINFYDEAIKTSQTNKRPIKVANKKVEQEIDKELNDLWDRREYKN